MPSLYICVFILVALCALITLIKPDSDKYLYYICFAVMTVFLALRYGQGTDYAGYLEIYHQAKEAFDPEYGLQFFLRRTHTEIGWKLLMILLYGLKIDFQIFVVVLSLIMMFFTNKFIEQYCGAYKTTALVLLYPTVYLTYYFSGWRQGIAMAIFFGILLKKLLDKKYIYYVVVVVLLCTIHKSALIYFAAPLIILVKDKWIKYLFAICAIFSGLMIFEPTRNLVYRISLMIGAGKSYFSAATVTISWFSLLEKLVMFGIILILWFMRDEQKDKDDQIKAILKVYCLNLMIYICLLTSPAGAGRLSIMFKMAEVILIPMLLSRVKVRIRNAAVLLIVMISTVMSYKNIAFYSEGYFKEINAWNYPYITIFNQQDALLYRNEAIKIYEDRPYDFYESDYMWEQSDALGEFTNEMCR